MWAADDVVGLVCVHSPAVKRHATKSLVDTMLMTDLCPWSIHSLASVTRYVAGSLAITLGGAVGIARASLLPSSLERRCLS